MTLKKNHILKINITARWKVSGSILTYLKIIKLFGKECAEFENTNIILLICKQPLLTAEFSSKF